MSYASYEQEQQDQEVFRKLVAAHKAQEQRDEELRRADRFKATKTYNTDIKWMVNATPIRNNASDVCEILGLIGITECENK